MSASKVSHNPEGYHTVTPYLTVSGGARAIEFYQKAFGASELYRLPAPDGKIAHAEIQIGTSRVMLSDEYPDWGALSPKTIGGTPLGLMIYVPDCDAVYHRAIAEGATSLMPVTDQFYGDRSGSVLDPFGHKWTIATHTEDVAPDEIARRAAAMFAQKQ